MAIINAQTDNTVNAETVKRGIENTPMPTKPVYKPSAFWRRLEESIGDLEKYKPLNPTSLARKLRMSQGTVHRWFSGVGYPELDTALLLAKEGGVCIDWLLNNVKPKYPISKDPVLRELFEVSEQLSEKGRAAILRNAKGELIQEQLEMEDKKERMSI